MKRKLMLSGLLGFGMLVSASAFAAQTIPPASEAGCKSLLNSTWQGSIQLANGMQVPINLQITGLNAINKLIYDLTGTMNGGSLTMGSSCTNYQPSGATWPRFQNASFTQTINGIQQAYRLSLSKVSSLPNAPYYPTEFSGVVEVGGTWLVNHKIVDVENGALERVN